MIFMGVTISLSQHSHCLVCSVMMYRMKSSILLNTAWFEIIKISVLVHLLLLNKQILLLVVPQDTVYLAIFMLESMGDFRKCG